VNVLAQTIDEGLVLDIFNESISIIGACVIYISGSHGGELEDGCFLDYCVV
jgi:hypothetical protein